MYGAVVLDSDDYCMVMQKMQFGPRCLMPLASLLGFGMGTKQVMRFARYLYFKTEDTHMHSSCNATLIIHARIVSR